MNVGHGDVHVGRDRVDSAIQLEFIAQIDLHLFSLARFYNTDKCIAVEGLVFGGLHTILLMYVSLKFEIK